MTRFRRKTEAIQQHLHRLAAEERMMLGLLMYSGMRRGEMLAMRWENIDFSNNEINVREAVSYRNGMPRLGMPKSKASIRKIPLDCRLKALLVPYRQISGFVIGESLTPLAEKAFQRRWRRIAETIDLHGATPHVFRHTYISIAVAAGVDPKTVQAFAGHADIETTLEVYAHVRQKNVEEAGGENQSCNGAKIAFCADGVQAEKLQGYINQRLQRFVCAESVQKCLQNTKTPVFQTKVTIHQPKPTRLKPLTNKPFTGTISLVCARSSAG